MALLLSGFAVASGEPQSGIAPVRQDEWHLIYFADEPVGYVHRTVRARPGGGYRVIDSQKLALRRNETRVELEMSSSIEEDAAGQVIGFHILQKSSGVPLEASAIRSEAGGALIVTERARGTAARSRSIPLPPDTLGPVRAIETMRTRLKETGDTIELRVLRPDARSCVMQKAVLGPREPLELLDGTKKVLRRVDVSGPGVASIRWVDQEFSLYRSSTPLLGQALVTRRATRERVLRHDFTSPPEVFVASFVPARGRVPAGAEEARYRLSSRRGLLRVDGNHVSQAPGQTIARRTDRAVEITVRRVRPERTSLQASGGLDGYLGSNRYLQTNDHRLAERARAIVGDGSDDSAGSEGSDPWKSARTLSRWVHGNIEEKSLDTVFATAREVLDTRRGDCTEHAVLLAAMCRAVGVPSRVTAGLVFREDSFAGHMWVEVHVGGWVPLDPTQEDPTVYADHIALATSSLEGAGLTEVFGGIVHVIGNLEIEVLEARPGWR